MVALPPDWQRGDPWPTRLVAIVTSWMCYLPKTPQDLPQWMLDDKDITYLVYQRKNASLPFYTPNYGKEASVHFQFVHEFYHHLPEQTAFLHENPSDHSPDWRDWLRCLKPDANYSSLVRGLVWHRTPQEWGAFGAAQETCWRHTLHAFGMSNLLPAGTLPNISFHCCTQSVASKYQLQRQPRSAYARAQRMIGVGAKGRCGLDAAPARTKWSELSYAKDCGTDDADAAAAKCGVLLERPAGALSIRDPSRGTSAVRVAGGPSAAQVKSRPTIESTTPDRWEYMVDNSLTQGWEVLQPTIIGGQPLGVSPHGWCNSFLPHSECPGSPCQMPNELLRKKYQAGRATKHMNKKVASRDAVNPCL